MTIKACENWRELRSESGAFWHPVFFERYSEGSDYDKKLEEHNLQVDGWYLGEGYPREKEVKLREIYDCFNNIRSWDPDITNIENPEGWFILWLADTEDGPYVCWAKVKSDTGATQ